MTAETLRQRFLEPSAESRPTPLYWWSGGDLDPQRLEWQLDKLCEKGIGGTVVGYSHLPDGRLDHGDPAPLTPNWWSLFRWFVSASAQRGMTVGFQDYGIIGGILVQAAEVTSGCDAGSLVNDVELVTGPAIFTRTVPDGAILSLRALEHEGARVIDAAAVEPAHIVWTVPDGQWLLSTVRRVPGRIGLVETGFDPMHPGAGAAVIELFYSRFAEELGDLFGATFTTFFQDELDLGLIMPMWNSLVRDALAERGFAPDSAIHSLWHGDGDAVMSFRAEYRDIVVALLEKHYFQPIFTWHDERSTMIVMDQLSRGDLRLGRAHYADFMQTMAWYHGPGNDDPDLTGSRNIAAFKTSASIAHLHGRPRVTNEAFHSSGWGVTPHMIVGGLNVGFAAGSNQVMLHGLDYTTDGGWWEWASPDFHFRQPWWEHSRELWRYISRVSETLRAGVPVSDVGIIDPTQDLTFASTSRSPEAARTLIAALAETSIACDFVPQAYLEGASVSVVSGATELSVLQTSYRAIVLPGLHVLRQDAMDALSAFVRAGGIVIAVGRMPSRTELATLTPADTEGWHLVEDVPREVASSIRRLIDADLDLVNDSVMCAHRRVERADLYFMVNSGKEAVEVNVGFRRTGALEKWDPWTGTMTLVDDVEFAPDHRGVTRLRTRLRLEPLESILLYQDAREAHPGAHPSSEPLDSPEVVRLTSGWTAEVITALDNRFGDFVSGAEPLAVSTYHVESSDDAGGPWSPAQVDHGTRFWALGPVHESNIEAMDRILPILSRVNPDIAVREGGSFWRPYRLSFTEGLQQDPYLLDRMTGPHGLKGTSPEFLDPRFLDESPPPGTAYYFWSTVESGAESSTLYAQGRCAHSVWINGTLLLAQAETPGAFFPPWGLRDMSTVELALPVVLPEGATSILVKVVVSAEQPSRVAAVLGGTRPGSPERSRMLWWQGDDPALHFTVENPGDGDGEVWIKAAVPPGAFEAVIPTSAQLMDAGDATPTAIEGGYRLVLGGSGSTDLIFALRHPTSLVGFADAGALTGPIVWSLRSVEVALEPWSTVGLHDYSGIVRYECTVELDDLAGRSATLELLGVEGSAEVTINGEAAGSAYSPKASIRVDGLLRAGRNSIRIDAANTLVNLYSRLPSPFSNMQQPNGGVGDVRLIIL